VAADVLARDEADLTRLLDVLGELVEQSPEHGALVASCVLGVEEARVVDHPALQIVQLAEEAEGVRPDPDELDEDGELRHQGDEFLSFLAVIRLAVGDEDHEDGVLSSSLDLELAAAAVAREKATTRLGEIHLLIPRRLDDPLQCGDVASATSLRGITLDEARAVVERDFAELEDAAAEVGDGHRAVVVEGQTCGQCHVGSVLNGAVAEQLVRTARAVDDGEHRRFVPAGSEFQHPGFEHGLLYQRHHVRCLGLHFVKQFLAHYVSPLMCYIVY